MVAGAAEPAANAEAQKRSSDARRSNKPIMEKRRRARINHCLNELKTLILDAMKKDPARHAKLEKADILEMTVRHLENLQRQQTAIAQVTDPLVLNKFRAGFSECASEVSRFPGLEPGVRRRLLQHLATCLAGAKPEEVRSRAVQVQLDTPPATAGGMVQLVPARLPNGDLALVMPTGTVPSAVRSPALPTLVPLVNSAAATQPQPTQAALPQQQHSPVCLSRQHSPPEVHQVLMAADNSELAKPWRPW